MDGGSAIHGAGDRDLATRLVSARLPRGTVVKIQALDSRDDDEMTSVGLNDLSLSGALESVGEVATLVRKQVAKAKPSKATVELEFGFAVESGKLTALWVGGKGEATLKVTLEWSGADRDEGEGADTGNSGGGE